MGLAGRGLCLLVLAAASVSAGDGATGSIGGVVRTPDGEPLPRAGIYVRSLSEHGVPRWPGTFGELEGERAAVTDAKGRYRVDALAPGRYYVSAWAPGYAAGEFGVDTDWQERLSVPVRGGRHLPGIDLSVAHALRVRGRVVDSDGAGIEGASISVSARDEHGRGGGGGGVTDAEGRYDLGPWPFHGPARLRVRVRHRDHAFRELEGIEAAPGRIVEVPDLRPLPDGTVRGKVKPPRAGSAAPVVHCGQRSAEVDREGWFEIGRVCPGHYRIRVDMKDGLPFVAGPVVDVKPGGAVGPLEVEVGAATSIRGRVLDGSGRPHPDVVVAALPPDLYAGSGDEEAWARPEADGTFELRVRAGIYRVGVASLHSGLDGYLELDDAVPMQQVEAGAHDVRIVVRFAGVVAGKVVDAGDEFVSIDLVRPTGPTNFHSLSMGDGFRGLVAEPGVYRIQIGMAGRAKYSTKPLEFRDDRLVDLGEIRLGPPATVSGTVTDARGQPAPHAKMHFLHAETGALFVDYDTWFADVTGRFECAMLPAGTYTVLAMAPGSAPAIRSGVRVAQGGRADVELKAPAAARLVVTVKDAQGRPVENADLMYRPEGLDIFVDRDFRTYEPPSYGFYRSDAEGRVVKPLMRPGRVELRVETRDGAKGRATATLDTAKETRVEITVK